MRFKKNIQRRSYKSRDRWINPCWYIETSGSVRITEDKEKLIDTNFEGEII